MGFGVGYSVSEQTKTNEQEIINTCEDLIHWIHEDVGNGYLDGEISESYLYNIEGIIARPYYRGNTHYNIHVIDSFGQEHHLGFERSPTIIH
jgi:hypothetical protein